jgi:hypothetical protein
MYAHSETLVRIDIRLRAYPPFLWKQNIISSQRLSRKAKQLLVSSIPAFAHGLTCDFYLMHRIPKPKMSRQEPRSRQRRYCPVQPEGCFNISGVVVIVVFIIIQLVPLLQILILLALGMVHPWVLKNYYNTILKVFSM